MYREDRLPVNFKIVGIGRKPVAIKDLKAKIEPFVEVKNEKEREKYEQFWKRISYVDGDFTKEPGYQKLKPIIDEIEKGKTANRLYYLALPPAVYETTSKGIHDFGSTNKFVSLIIYYQKRITLFY